MQSKGIWIACVGLVVVAPAINADSHAGSEVDSALAVAMIKADTSSDSQEMRRGPALMALGAATIAMGVVPHFGGGHPGDALPEVLRAFILGMGGVAVMVGSSQLLTGSKRGPDGVDRPREATPVRLARAATVAIGPRGSIVVPRGDVSDILGAGWSLGGDLESPLSDRFGLTAAVTHTTFAPRPVFRKAGLNLDYSITSLEAGGALAINAASPARLGVTGGIGIYHARSSLVGELRDPETSDVVSIDVHEESTSFGLHLGLGISVPGAAGVSYDVRAGLRSLFDRETIDGVSLGPTEYYTLSLAVMVPMGER